METKFKFLEGASGGNQPRLLFENSNSSFLSQVVYTHSGTLEKIAVRLWCGVDMSLSSKLQQYRFPLTDFAEYPIAVMVLSFPFEWTIFYFPNFLRMRILILNLEHPPSIFAASKAYRLIIIG